MNNQEKKVVEYEIEQDGKKMIISFDRHLEQ